ncbi:Heptahelical transmembrane protein 4 [Citrus sinensis]|nr:heptahelical transmembrane protein 4 [Citrus x clementina]XP_006472313.2 heptahelical transmembrane protein 4-like [Citrus sinensis]ESR46887.1 hypothetical protein CICLE_v10001488mg [Citrus x clementina]ESR46888.1 hypothetical protein CICLE_v10001488mg [Citrus x clementina]KAH9689950.1 Heptahelical transmembrane protein 4 [Citrus sinensis]KDO81491.1 hypothetical protein CISIN_1g016259mg [Citrus sinensis]
MMNSHSESSVDPWETCDLLDCKEGKAKKNWKKAKWHLVEYQKLPLYLRDNEYIVGYYRSEWPLKQILLSIFSIHNETLNVWTHLIGFFLFLFLTIYTAMRVPAVVHLDSLQRFRDMLPVADWHKIQEQLLSCFPSMPNIPDPHRLMDVLKIKMSWPSMDFLTSLSACLKDDVVNKLAPITVQAITRWPIFTFLGGAMFCLLASSTCHLLCCHSERLSYIMLRLDYAGIAALISTSFYPPIYYSFMCYPFLCNLYLGFITVLGIATIVISLLPVFEKPKFRSFRASLFFGMGISGVAPVLHKLILFRDKPEAVQTTGYEILMGLFYGFGALIYAMRVPERWKPGKFDIAGHSHQLFHVLVVAGAYTHYLDGLVYLRWRDLEGC